MLNILNTSLPILLFLIALGGLVGFFISLKQGKLGTATTIQEKVIVALQAQNAATEAREKAEEKEKNRQKQITKSLCREFERQYGIQVEINGETITFIEQGKRARTTFPIEPTVPDKKDATP